MKGRIIPTDPMMFCWPPIPDVKNAKDREICIVGDTLYQFNADQLMWMRLPTTIEVEIVDSEALVRFIPGWVMSDPPLPTAQLAAVVSA